MYASLELTKNVYKRQVSAKKKKTRKETRLKLYNLMAVTALLYGYESWVSAEEHLEYDTGIEDEILEIR